MTLSVGRMMSEVWLLTSCSMRARAEREGHWGQGPPCDLPQRNASKAGDREERTSDKTSGADAMTASSLLESVDGPAEEVRPAKLKASDWACFRRSLSSSESS